MLHAYLDSAVLELGPCSEGGCPILVTQLDNPAMPLIRYQNGDLSRWKPMVAPCACGLHYPALDGIQGRISDLFHFAGGRVIHGEYFTHIMYDVAGVRAFQFRQHRSGDITLFVVPEAATDHVALVATLRHQLDRAATEAGVEMRSDVQVVTAIPLMGEGKFRFTVSEYAS
jgi:phenylacetate-CoA ligase